MMVSVRVVLILCLIAFASARRRKLFARDAASFAAGALAEHNKYRAIHNAPNMVLNDAMSAEAQAYAEYLASLPDVTIKHDNTKYGENIFAACNSELTTSSGADATASWYNEVCDPGYDFNNPGYDASNGHFTQVVWKGSTQLGIGYATKSLYGGYFLCTFVVGRYEAIGNNVETFDTNVDQGSFDKTACPPKEDKKEAEDKIHVFKKDAKPRGFMRSSSQW